MTDPEFIVHRIDGVTVSVDQRYCDGYINITKLSNAYRIKTGQRRDPSEWTGNIRTQQMVEHLSRSTGIPVDFLIVTVADGPNERRGTYIHPRLAVRFGIWLSDDFGLLVEDWVQNWVTSGRSPLADIDRVGLRAGLKDESRLRMTDQVKLYLENIQRYDDKKYRGIFFAQVHDAINVTITGETSKQMRIRLSGILGKMVKEDELIRDYFPSDVLQRYIAVSEATANFMIRDGKHPLTAVEEAADIVLYAGYRPQPINFVEHIALVRRRLTSGQGEFKLPEG